MSERLVVVSVGSYHVPFDRLLRWVESWHRTSAHVRLVVQHGPGEPVDGAENHDFVPWDVLQELSRAADAVVLQGGAGAILDCAKADRVPIVVPRVPTAGEVVDDHQVEFCRRAEKLGLVHLAETQPMLHDLLDRGLSGRLVSRTSGASHTAGVEAASRMLEAAVGGPRARPTARIRGLLGSRLRRR